jgi:hypothetical protein
LWFVGMQLLEQHFLCNILHKLTLHCWNAQ